MVTEGIGALCINCGEPTLDVYAKTGQPLCSDYEACTERAYWKSGVWFRVCESCERGDPFAGQTYTYYEKQARQWLCEPCTEDMKEAE